MVKIAKLSNKNVSSSSSSSSNLSLSLSLSLGVQDGFCDSMGTCDRVRNLPQEEKYQFEAHLISGVCLCR